MSLLELNERAQGRIEEIRRANALKSQQKIKELTAEHKKQGKGSSEDKKRKQSVEQDVIMSGDSDEEEKKSEPKRAKNGKNGPRREPLDGEERPKSKGTLAASKLASKRS